MYFDRLSAKDYDHLRIHSYRAAAERILAKHRPHLRHSGLKGVNIGTDMPFEE